MLFDEGKSSMLIGSMMKKLLSYATSSIVMIVFALSGHADHFPDPDEQCLQTDSQAEKHLNKSIDWMRLERQTPTASGVRLGEHFIAQNCEQYQGGLPALGKEITTQLEQGLACMSQLPGRFHEDAVTLTSLLLNPPRPITLQCGRTKDDQQKQNIEASFQSSSTVARAHMCSDKKNFPGIDINLTALEEEKYKNQDWVLHEFVHLLGYKHTGGVDYTYLVSMCCLHDRKSIREQACNLIRKIENKPMEQDVYTFYALVRDASEPLDAFFKAELNALLGLLGAEPNYVFDTISAVLPVAWGGTSTSERALQRASQKKKLPYIEKVFRRIIHLYVESEAEQEKIERILDGTSLCLHEDSTGVCLQSREFHTNLPSEQKWARELFSVGQPLLGIAAYSMALEVVDPWLPSDKKQALKQWATDKLVTPFYPVTDPIDNQKQAFAWELGRLSHAFSQWYSNDILAKVYKQKAQKLAQKLCGAFSDYEKVQLMKVTTLSPTEEEYGLKALASLQVCKPPKK